MSVLETSTSDTFLDIGRVELSVRDFQNVERVLRESQLSIEEFCVYCLSAVAETHVNADGTVTRL